ncbi:MAG: hypothetical protein DRP74_02400 [Candidatus Omnitrophota bacterium]|nr:MAG: hypothetical protein DRP74_02400 [Candidatus Omnitrophota bacterium]
MEGNTVIRKYRNADRQAVHELSCDTAYFGDPCEFFFPDRKLLADLIMSYYTDYEPQHIWVAEFNNEVVGYISAGLDESLYARQMLLNIIPRSLLKAMLRGKIWDKRTLRLIKYNLLFGFSGEGRLKKLRSEEFPAHIHQNIRYDFRGKGIGSKLFIALYEDINKKAKGIQFKALRQEPKFPFFEKYGFKLLDLKRVKVWERWLKKSPLYYMEYGKKINE